MKQQLLKTLDNSREYTLQVAAAMPNEGYDFKPTDAVWNFRELLHHIAYGIQWWENNYVKKKETAWEPTPVTPDKETTMRYLEDAYAGLRTTISNAKDTEAVAKGFYTTLDHITHHRGQAVVFLRCKGITPPEYMY